MNRRSIVTLAAAQLLALAPPLGAVIIPQQGIGGARIGDSRERVLRAVGTPVRTLEGTNEFGPYTEFRYRGFRVVLQGRTRVTSTFTRSTTQRTRSGIGPGSTERALRRRIPAVTCRRIAGVRDCEIGSGEPGTRVTRFAIANGRVSTVVVGIVID